MNKDINHTFMTQDPILQANGEKVAKNEAVQDRYRAESKEQRIEECAAHPEKEQIFTLEKMLSEAGYPFYFNYRQDLRPTPFGQMDPGAINWDTYGFLIEVGGPVGCCLSEISVTFSTGNNKKLLELLDMRPAKDKPDARAEDGELTVDLTAEQCMEIIGKFFEG